MGHGEKPLPPGQAKAQAEIASKHNAFQAFFVTELSHSRVRLHAPPFALEMAPKALEGFKLFLYISAPISAAFLYNSVRP